MTRLPLLALVLQEETGMETTGEETTSLAEEAADAAGDTARETFGILSAIRDFLEDAYAYLTSTEFLGNILASAVVVVLGLVAYRLLTRGVPRVIRWRRRRRDEILDSETVSRLKRQDTAITLLRNGLRYVVFVIVALTILSIFIKNPLPGVAGATIAAAVLGFGAQSFLRDVIAGFSIVFEGQYSVGDFIEISPPQGVSGIVEELGLRMTKLRMLSGEVAFVPNGAILGVVNYVSGSQRFNVEVQVTDSEAADRVLGSLKEAAELYLTPPRLVEREENDGRIRLRILADVLPSMAWLVEENLTGRIKAAAGEDAMAAEPLIYKVDQANLRRIRSLIPHQDDRLP
jgi:small conductance mechanosensitive channel